MLAALALAAALGAADPCVAGEGREDFATCFDPGNRLALGLGAARDESGVPVLLEGELKLRRSRASRSHEHVAWSTEHAFAHAELMHQRDAWFGSATLYDGLFLRHLDDGFLLLPTNPPLRVRFPFDVAVEARLGDARRDRDGTERLEVGRAGLLLDAARDASGARRLALGPSLAYAIERSPTGVMSSSAQPLTGGTLLARAETDSGLWAAQARVDAGHELLLPRGGANRVDARAELERVIFAVNDEPFALQLSGRGLWRSGAPADLRVGLALVAALEL